MPTRTLPALTAMGNVLDLDPEAFGEMRESADILHNTPALRARMKEDGYLLLRGLLNRDEVLGARREMLSRLERDGWLQPGTDLMEGIVNPGTEMLFRPDLAQDNTPLRWALYGGPLIEFFERFLGGPILHYTYTWVRCIAPGQGTPPHQDIVYMGRGTKKLYTTCRPDRYGYAFADADVYAYAYQHPRASDQYPDVYADADEHTDWADEHPDVDKYPRAANRYADAYEYPYRPHEYADVDAYSHTCPTDQYPDAHQHATAHEHPRRGRDCLRQKYWGGVVWQRRQCPHRAGRRCGGREHPHRARDGA